MSWEVLPPRSETSLALAPSGTHWEVAPRGHRYAVRIIGMAIELVLLAHTSLRAAARCFLVWNQGVWPSLWTIRFWLLRLGLYELRRAKPWASDWGFIVDASIAVGQHKALVILGARLGSMRERGFNLGHQQVVTLGLSILSKCDGEAVHAQLEAAARAVGVPRAVVSDRGGDVPKGMRLFREAHPEVAWIYDLTHGLARLLEKELGKAAWWGEFLTQVGQCRHGCQQTAWSHLLPPTQRTKARWFNLEPLIGWGRRVLAYGRREGLQEGKFAQLFGWLSGFEEHLQEAAQMVEMIQSVCARIKRQGLSAEQVEWCANRIEAIARTERTQAFGGRVLEFVREQAALARPGEKLLGSSDVIESMFGKYKGAVERSPLKAITEMVLLVAAWTSPRTPELIREAMETVGTAEVGAWFEANGEPSLLAKRRAALRDYKGTQPV